MESFQSRKRDNFSQEQLHKLEQAWLNGLQSTKKEMQAEIERLAKETSLNKDKVEVWIGNRRAKQKRAGKGSVSIKKKKLLKGPTAYSLFSQQFKRATRFISHVQSYLFFRAGETPKEQHLHNIAVQWAITSDEEKRAFKEKAFLIRSDPLKGMDKGTAAEHHMALISNSCAVLGSLGYEIGAIAMKKDEAPNLFGTKKSVEYLQQHTIQEDFKKFIFGNIVYINNHDKRKQNREELREEVRKLFNTCWASAIGRRQPVPYAQLLKKCLPYKIDGLPAGIVFKDPSAYGLGSLKHIISSKESIKFVKCDLASVHDLTTESTDQKTNEVKVDIGSMTGQGEQNSQQADIETVNSVLTDSNIRLENVHCQDMSEDMLECLSSIISEDNKPEEITLLPESQVSLQSGFMENKKRKREPKGKQQKNNAIVKTELMQPTLSKKNRTKKYDVEYLVDSRETKKGYEFLVHWKGYSEEEHTWEPLQEMPSSLVNMYWKNRYSK